MDYETIMKHLKNLELQIDKQKELYSNLTEQLVQRQKDTKSNTNLQAQF